MARGKRWRTTARRSRPQPVRIRHDRIRFAVGPNKKSIVLFCKHVRGVCTASPTRRIVSYHPDMSALRMDREREEGKSGRERSLHWAQWRRSYKRYWALDLRGFLTPCLPAANLSNYRFAAFIEKCYWAIVWSTHATISSTRIPTWRAALHTTPSFPEL
jgi:hypothetical protein